MDHRVFIAINFPEKDKKSIAKVMEKWKNFPSLRLVKTENLHLTILFLENVSDENLVSVKEKIFQIAKKTGSFDLKFDEISYGPRDSTLKERPRMIWLNGKKSDTLIRFQEEIAKSFQDLKLKNIDLKKFRPHITLARIRPSDSGSESLPKKINERIDISFLVDSIELMESLVENSERKYSVLLSSKFGIK